MTDPIIEISGLTHTYLQGTPRAVTALSDVDFSLSLSEAVGLVGPSGAGKSTLAQFCNGLLRPAARQVVQVAGIDTAQSSALVQTIHQRIGLVFQNPSDQLFEQYVGDDVAYGPRQLGLTREQVSERVRWALSMVGLDFDSFVNRFTFSLSGGEMRRVALAGVLALRPDVLILDETTAGLDPQGRAELLDLLSRWHKDAGLTLLLITTRLSDLPDLVDRVVVLKCGRVALEGSTVDVLGQSSSLAGLGLAAPPMAQLSHHLSRGGLDLPSVPLTVSQAEDAICKALRP